MTNHFSDSEILCSCGCGLLPVQSFMDRVEELRVRYGKPLKVTSAARCPDYNQKVSKTGRNGPHTTGRAIDLGVSGGDALLVVKIALEMGFTGIGVQQKGAGRFIHLDTLPNAVGCPRPWMWSYS